MGTRLATGLVLLSVLVGAHPLQSDASPQAVGANGQGTLLVIGDSLTVGSDAFGSLATRLRTTSIWPRVTMDAREGRTAATGAITLRNRLTRHTTAIVIALGTNDMISKPEPWYPSWVIDKVMSQTRGTPVLWLTLEFSDTSRLDWRQRASRFNRALRIAQSKWPTLMIADWNSHFKPNRVSRFIADGVHLTVNGYRTRATFSLKQISLFGSLIVDSSTTTTTTPTTTTVEPTTTSIEPTTTTTVAPAQPDT